MRLLTIPRSIHNKKKRSKHQRKASFPMEATQLSLLPSRGSVCIIMKAILKLSDINWNIVNLDGGCNTIWKTEAYEEWRKKETTTQWSRKVDRCKRCWWEKLPQMYSVDHWGYEASSSHVIPLGDSAKALAVAGLSVVGRDRFGVIPLRGKILNVRDVKVGAFRATWRYSHTACTCYEKCRDTGNRSSHGIETTYRI